MEPILSYEVNKLTKICRVCLNTETIVNILDTQYKNISMKQIFLTIFHDKINEDEAGPVSLCGVCLELILNSYELLMKYENSQTILEKWQREMMPLVKCEINVAADEESVIESPTPSPAAEDVNNSICGLCDYDGRTTSINEQTSALQRHYLDEHLLEIEMEYSTFFCMKCNENFATLPEILQHTSSTKHQNKQCPICGKQLESIKQYYRHIKNDRCKVKDKPYSCRFCHVDLATFNDVLEHFKMNYHKFDKTCMLCGIANKIMCTHIMTHRPKETPYACVICLLSFADEGDYKAHKLQTDHKKIQCWLCEKYLIRRKFPAHLQSHRQKQQFACEVCGKIFSDRSNVTRHYKTSHEGIRFYCDQCTSSYTTKQALTKHVVEFHKENSLHDAICKVVDCLRTFSDANELKLHMKNEHGNLFCKACERNFYDKRQFETHMNLHIWKNNYKYEGLPPDQQIVCRICDMEFPHCEQLAEHLKQNYGLLMCPRDACLKVFANQTLLNQHKRYHNGKSTVAAASYSAKDRPFSCNVCLKRFRRWQQFIRHSRVHTGEKPYECRYCDKKFKHDANHKLHERMHTGEKPYSCRHCDRRFSNGAYASRHQNKCKINQNVDEEATEMVLKLENII